MMKGVGRGGWGALDRASHAPKLSTMYVSECERMRVPQSITQ